LGPGIGATTAQNNIFLDYTQRIAETQEEIEEENPTIRQTQGKERKKKGVYYIPPSHLTIMAAIVDWLDTPE
jgi:hypothetical protein